MEFKIFDSRSKVEFKNFDAQSETIVVPNWKWSSNSSQVAHCVEFDLISYLSLWILHNMHINRLLEGTRPFRTWLIYSAYSLGLSFLILWLLFEPSISNSLGIPQCSLVKCGCWSFLLAIQNVSAQSLESIPMYSMLSSWIGLLWFKVCHPWRAAGYFSLLLCHWLDCQTPWRAIPKVKWDYYTVSTAIFQVRIIFN